MKSFLPLCTLTLLGLAGCSGADSAERTEGADRQALARWATELDAVAAHPATEVSTLKALALDEELAMLARRQETALVIGFDDRTEFVWASDPNPLYALNAHVQNGGDPLGVVTSQIESEGYRSVRARPLAEYDDAEWVEKYLIEVLAAVRRNARDNGIEVGLALAYPHPHCGGMSASR